MKRDALRQIVADLLEIEPTELASDTDLYSFETFDSVVLLSLMIRLDERAGIKISPDEVQKIVRFGDIEAVAERQGIALED